MSAEDEDDDAEVTRMSELAPGEARELVGRYGLRLREVEPGAEIPGSHWGAPEAGIVGLDVWVRPDTPVHSFLHEASHTVCMDAERRGGLHTDAGGDDLEESGVCVLQVVLADELTGLGRERLMADMDRWGYSFRLGSTAAWFSEDAEDARAWLRDAGLLDSGDRPVWRLRD